MTLLSVTCHITQLPESERKDTK